MATHREFYDAIKNTSINADTINLNTDQVESKLDTATGLLTTLSADTAIIKADMADGVTVNGTVTANTGLTQSLTDAQLRNTAVPVSLATAPTTPVTGTFFQTTQPVSPVQGTGAALTTFTSTTASTQLIAASATRKALTVFNVGPSILYISATSSCTTTAGGYQLSLNAGDYWECPNAQITLAHTAVFASSGSTAGITAIT